MRRDASSETAKFVVWVKGKRGKGGGGPRALAMVDGMRTGEWPPDCHA